MVLEDVERGLSEETLLKHGKIERSNGLPFSQAADEKENRALDICCTRPTTKASASSQLLSDNVAGGLLFETLRQ